jgi:hypothetical protein
VKGAGVDCATLILCVMRNCGIIDDDNLAVYSGDWFIHTDEETYMKRVLRHAFKAVEGVAYRSLEAAAGNIVMTKAAGSRVYNHGGIVLAWPAIIHAVSPKVEEVNAAKHPMWAYQTVAVFDPWKKAEAEAA